MEPTGIEGTLWNILYYVTGAVNRFFRPDPTRNYGDDLLQESTVGSSLSSDAPTAAGICKDHSDMTAPVPGWAVEETPKTESKAELADSERKSAMTFFSLSQLSVKEKTVCDCPEASSQANMENTDCSKSDVGRQPEGFNEEHQENCIFGSERLRKTTNVEPSAVTTAESEQEEKMDELFNVDQDICKEEVISTVSVKPVVETAQEIDGTFKNVPLSVCDDSQQLHTLTREEPLPEQSSEAFKDETTQAFPNTPCDQTDDNTEDIQEEVKATAGFSHDNLFDDEKELKMGALISSTMAKDETENGIKDTEEQEEELSKDGGVEVNEVLKDTEEQEEELSKDGGLEVNEVLKDTATVMNLVKNTEEITFYSVSQNKDDVPEDVLNLGIPNASSEENVDSEHVKISSKKPFLEKRTLRVRSETESFIEISSPEFGFSDQSFWEAKEATTDDSSSDDFQTSVQNVLEMSTWEVLKTDFEVHRSDSEESQKELSTLSGGNKEKKKSQPKCEVESQAQFLGSLQGNTGVLNFAPQKSRISVKNPHARPPKDRHSLFLRPSVEPESAPPASKIPAGVQILGNLRLGIKVPGLPNIRKLPKMEDAEAKVPKADATKETEMPQNIKWIPPKQTGFGNPLMSELKTKLKKATNN
ncbi:uncharacterized protein LOC144092445 [Stigmatopora argus]